MSNRTKNIEKLPECVRLELDADSRECYLDGKLLRPERSQKIRNHSPDGFNWGYGGSGPAQLALAILANYMDDESAVWYYQQFKFTFIAGLPQNTDVDEVINLRQIITNLF